MGKGGVNMERLTQEAQIGPFASLKDKAEAKPCAFNDYDCFLAHARAVTALKAYEDICFDEDGKERITIEELSALVKARDEGLVVVLDEPHKPLVWGDDKHDTCLCPDCGEDLMGIPYGERMILQCPECGQYVDAAKVLTRAEAEAALGGGGDGV